MGLHKKGVSLITLIITVVVLIIIATITIQKGIQRTQDAQVAKHNTNISTIQEEVENYYYYNSESLPAADLTPYPVQAGSTLQSEIIKNGEESDNFYVLDMDKLGKVSGKEGTGIGNDIYIVSATKHNVYYVKGIAINGYTYHRLVNDGVGFLAFYVSPTPTISPMPTLSPTPTPSPSPTPVPGSGYFDGTLNSPKLSAGMTAVKWNGSAWVAANASNVGNDWYDYTVGVNKWANAQLADGSLLVWIPRYTYIISSNEHSTSTGTINIRYSNSTTDDTSGGYRVQPAFYWGGWNIPRSAAMSQVAGGTEVTGIWVGKFESSNNSNKVKIASNAASWNSLFVDGVFTACRNMQTVYSSNYGISTNTSVIDTHMLKQSEWGAVAYLSKYVLGGTEVSANISNIYKTANGDIVANKTQSTTRTEYGIYDMVGCGYDHVASYIANGDSSLTTYANSLYTAAAKYKEVFPQGTTDNNYNNYVGASNAYGYAIYETSGNSSGNVGWFSDFVAMPYYSHPLFMRGGDWMSSASDLGLFNLYYSDGSGGYYPAFHVGVVVP